MSIGRDRKIPDDPELRERPQRAKKNTKRWCKGKVGRDHVVSIAREKGRDFGSNNCIERQRRSYRYVEGYWWAWWCNHIEQCENCGRIMRFSLKKEECPDFIEANKKEV